MKGSTYRSNPGWNENKLIMTREFVYKQQWHEKIWVPVADSTYMYFQYFMKMGKSKKVDPLRTWIAKTLLYVHTGILSSWWPAGFRSLIFNVFDFSSRRPSLGSPGLAKLGTGLQGTLRGYLYARNDQLARGFVAYADGALLHRPTSSDRWAGLKGRPFAKKKIIFRRARHVLSILNIPVLYIWNIINCTEKIRSKEHQNGH